jgi:sodium/hydrogen antiporter
VMLGLGLLGLHNLGASGLQWVLVDVVWATVGGISIGVVAGMSLARMGWWLRSAPRRHELLDDLLGLGFIGVVYGLSVGLHAWGFLAVFFGAVALRQTEMRLARREPVASVGDLPSRAAAVGSAAPDAEPADSVSGGALVFKEHLERLSELVLVLLLGGSLYLNSWSWPAVGLALFLFFIARPLSVFTGLLGTRTLAPVRGMTAWFGVRGIGSLYYLMYAIQHGLPQDLALQLMQLTLIVVTLSILLHGISVKPLMKGVWDRGR